MQGFEKEVHSRRSFLKGAAVCATGIAAVGIAGCSAPVKEEAAKDVALDASAKWDVEVDVIVCGSGTGGAPAAIEAADAGASVLMIEKKDWLGGSLRRCGGGMLGANTKVQQKLGITDDTPDMLYEYLLACGEGLTDKALVRVLADNAGKNIDWVIEDLGGQPLDKWNFSTPEDRGEEICIKPGLNVSGTPVYFDKFDMPEYRRARCHWFSENPEDIDPGDRYYSDYSTRGDGTWVGRGGTGLWKPFEAALKSREIEIMTETVLKSLVVGESGEVVGIVAEQKGKEVRYKANKGVVLATGGFTRNEDMMLDYRQVVFAEFPEEKLRGGSPAPGECDGSSLLAAFDLGSGVKTIACSSGGIKINADAQVVDVFGKPIERLYASSKAIGGIYGNIYPVCGAYVSAFICFGRIAGQNVAKLDNIV